MEIKSTEDYLREMSNEELIKFLSRIPVIADKAIKEQKAKYSSELFAKIPKDLVEAYYLSNDFNGKAEHDIVKWCIRNFDGHELNLIRSNLSNIAPHIWYQENKKSSQ